MATVHAPVSTASLGNNLTPPAVEHLCIGGAGERKCIFNVLVTFSVRFWLNAGELQEKRFFYNFYFTILFFIHF